MKHTDLSKFKWLFVSLLCLIPFGAFAQGIDIQGVVKDTYGETIIGVNVMEKGTNNGVITDIEGRFTLKVSTPNSTLVFSYMGYLTTEVAVGSQRSLNVILKEDTQQLDEVVVIGYGTARKTDITGAVARANLSALENSPNVNFAEALKGVVPGLNIGVIRTAGGNPDISIRGRNSISGSRSPLIVLDGIIFRGDFTDINPADIESVDVLKDASSTAIYGSQGANGVMLITTKRAKGVSKPVIEYSGQLSYQRLMKDLKILDADGYLNQLENLFISESRMGPDLLQRNPDFQISSKIKENEILNGYFRDPKTNTDWFDLLSNSFPYIQSHNLSVRGRSETTNYFISYGYSDQENIIINDKYNRHSVRINLETAITDWLKIGTNSSYNISDFSGNSVGFGDLTSIPALITPYEDDGKTVKLRHTTGGINPLLRLDQPRDEVRNILSGTFYGEINIPWVKGLSYRANYSRNATNYKRFTFDPYAENLLGRAEKYYTEQIDMTFDNIVTFKRDFGKHSVNATFVYGVEKRKYNNTLARANRFDDPSLGYNNLQQGQADLSLVESSAWKESSLYSMGRVLYTYNQRYSFTGTVRRDGFSGFGAGKKFGVFPSAAIAWRLSEESFIKDNVKWIDDLKLRLSYGQNGNRTIGRYATMATMATNSAGYVFGDGGSGERRQNIDKMANNNLKWETTTSANIGLDFSVLQGRLSGNYEFYTSTTRDLLYDVNYPWVNGAGKVTIPTNIGKLRNLGHEFSINAIPVKTKDFTWDVTLNFSLNKNKVVSILGPGADGKEEALIASNIFPGHSLDPVYDFNIIGMWQVADYNAGIIPQGFTYGVYKIEDINKDGEYSMEHDRKILGYRDPLYRFSIINSLKYKGFDLRVMINSVQGGKDHYLGRPARNMPIPDHLQDQAYTEFDYWTPENPNAKYRQLGFYNTVVGNQFSPYVSRSFIRLQELSLTYHFPSSLLKGTFINRAKVFVTGTNLFTITKWDGWDPEADQGIGHNFSSYGDNYGGGPSMKSYSVGVNFEF